MNSGIIKKMQKEARRNKTKMMIIDVIACLVFIVSLLIVYILLWVITGRH